MKDMLIMGTVALILAVGAIPAQAIPIEVNFKAQNFASTAPNDPVTGTIIYEAASTTANIDFLTSSNMTIDGYTYSISEVGFISPFGPTDQLIFAKTGDTTVFAGTNDFYLRWNQNTLNPVSFAYASSSTPVSVWLTSDFANFTVTESTTPIPEPTTMLLLSSGLISLAGYGRKKCFKK
jgi:hypothetical protein